MIFLDLLSLAILTILPKFGSSVNYKLAIYP